MFHQFNKVTGRLIASAHLQSPLFPVAPVSLQRVDVGPIVHTATKMSLVTDASPTGASKQQRLIPGTNVPYAPVPESLRRKQELFQRDNGLPVFIKGGPADVFLYRLTLVLCGLGLVGVFDYIYSKAYPPKN